LVDEFEKSTSLTVEEILVDHLDIRKIPGGNMEVLNKVSAKVILE